ncbi:OsmC family protein [Rubrobacter calidifluminis]|uniref:OsmC family protein n=1 Tax=Rubrobacter calidifluminis TaxID=1392640 RepID=UPI00235FA2C9|nr:OsmC family protein [Rubrobacter calidifluminis]
MTDLLQKVEELRSQLASLESASQTFSVQSRLAEGVRTETKIRGFDLTVDEPKDLGGTDAGPNPVELVLAALATCQEIVYSVYAARAGVELERVEVDAEGDLDPRGFLGVSEEVRPGFENVRYRVRIESPSEPEKVRELSRLVDEHCPVFDILTRPVEVSGAVELNGSPLA